MAKFVLIVEKDATFQHLLEGKAVEKLGPCLIVTVSMRKQFLFVPIAAIFIVEQGGLKT